MYFNLLVIFMCLASVLASIENSTEEEEYDNEELPTPMELANQTLQWINCDGDKKDEFEEAIASVYKCLKQFDVDENWKDIAEKCYPGIFFPTAAQDAKTWFCNKPLEEIAKRIECEHAAFAELDSEEATELIEALQSCHWDSPDSSETDRDEDEYNEDSEEEYAVGEDENIEYT